MAGMLALALKTNSLLTSLAYSFRVCSFNTDYSWSKHHNIHHTTV